MTAFVWFAIAYFFVKCDGATINLYVSPLGNNSNNGSSTIYPFETLKYTQTYIRNNVNHKNNKIIVNLMNGTFYLEQPLEFIPSDSGYNITHNIVYKNINNKVNDSIISIGSLIPHSCWNLYDQTDIINIYKCDISKLSIMTKIKNNFRSIRINSVRGVPSRYPKLNISNDDNPYIDGWLFVNTSEYINNTSSFIISVNTMYLNKYNNGLINGSFKEGNIVIFPTHSWINCELKIESYFNKTSVDLTYFLVTCPIDNICIDTSPVASIGPGNRFYFYNISNDIIPIQQENEWYYDNINFILYVGINKNKSTLFDVIIPNSDYIIQLNGNVSVSNHYNPNYNESYVSFIEFKYLTFMDSDYNAYGFQNGWNTKPSKGGVPCNGSIRMSGASNINITKCSFFQLSGTGIEISNKSHNINIYNNYFIHLGQSGIALTGNNTSQSKAILISNNSFISNGEILASAAGIYGSTVSNSSFIFNNISYISRWGIAIRTNGVNTLSLNNIIKYNRIIMTGLKTRDYGGISVIGPIFTGTQIIYNCIKDSIGTDTNREGIFLRPFYSRGIYLDNFASGFYIYGNIIHSNVLNGIMIHGGNSNWIENNIFFNTSEWSPIGYGYTNDGQITIAISQGNTNQPLPFNNTMIKNVFFYYNTTSRLVHANTWNMSYFNQIDYNLYYNPFILIKNVNITDFTPNGPTWKSWINGNDKRFDQNSLIDQNPLFHDVNNGNFSIQPKSPLLSQIHFKAIPSYISNNC